MDFVVGGEGDIIADLEYGDVAAKSEQDKDLVVVEGGDNKEFSDDAAVMLEIDDLLCIVDDGLGIADVATVGRCCC